MAEMGFDLRSGELLIGAAAIEQRTLEAGPEVVPLAKLLITDEFPIQTGTYELLDTSSWTPDDYKAWGTWTVKVLSEAPEPAAFNRQHALRMRALGLGPVVKHLGKFTTFRASLGVDVIPEGSLHAKNAARERPEFFKWSDEQYVAYAARVAAWRGHRPRAADYDTFSEEEPSAWAIRQRFGSVATLNEHIGYPNYAEWQPRDFVQYGVNLIKANGYDTDIFVPHLFDAAAQNERGPWCDRVARIFNSWGEYKIAVLKTYYREREQKTQRYRAMAQAGRLPVEFQALNDYQLDQAAAKLVVTVRIVPDIDRTEAMQLALNTPSRDLLPTLQKYDPTLTRELLVDVATKAGTHDDLFPPAYVPYLTLTVDEIDAAILKTRQRGHRQRQRRRQLSSTVR
jgi:hypothetical protein